MFTASIIAALVAAGVATAKAIGKGVQAKRQRESRQTEQQRHLAAMQEASLKQEKYRQYSKEQAMFGMQKQQEQMQPLQDAMTRAYGGSAGYEAPDMRWLMNYGKDPRPNTGGGGGSRVVRNGDDNGKAKVTKGPLSPSGARPSSPLGKKMQAGADRWGPSAGGVRK